MTTLKASPPLVTIRRASVKPTPPARQLRAVRALFVDIDDTIIRGKHAAHDGDSDGASSFDSGSLMQVLRTAGPALAGLTPEETNERIDQIRREVRWWHWSDFIVALDLNPRAFWEYAYEMEARYLEPTGADIGASLARLRDAGMLLYVTSNNPSSGILHKLRLAGLGNLQGCPLFDQLLGATELHALKWEPVYWKKALAHVGIDAHEVAVVGDNPHDDYAVPHDVGIPYSFILNRNTEPAPPASPASSHAGEGQASIIRVSSFTQIADLLEEARRGADA